MTDEAVLIYDGNTEENSIEQSYQRMSPSKRVILPLAAGLAGASLLASLYFGVVSWAESPQHAAE
jgi:hypothetical protein